MLGNDFKPFKIGDTVVATPTPDSKPVDKRVTGYPYSPFVNVDGDVIEWEPSSPGCAWPGIWLVNA